MLRYFTFLSLFFFTLHSSFSQCDDFEIHPMGMTVSCLGDCDGLIWGNDISGGTQPYSIEWSDGTTVWDYADVGSLCPGTYCITVTDANNCSLSECVDVTEPNELTLTLSGTAVSCGTTNCDGTAISSALGGTSPYIYAWSNGAITENVNTLCAGEYCLSVTDDHGCEVVECITVNESLSVSLDVLPVSCNGGSDGSMTAIASAGTPPYTYIWNTGSTSSTISNLSAETYCVTIEDATGCQIFDCATVTQPNGLSLDLDPTDVSCFAGTDGSISSTGSGGVLPYTYLWSNGSTNSSISNLNANEYCLTLTDANGCEISDCATVDQPTELLLSSSVTNVSCLGDTDGSILITGSGGTLPYSYLWNTTDNGANITNLAQGIYTVTVTDANACSNDMTISVGVDGISDGDAFIIQEISTLGATDGIAGATGSGGTLPYSYTWSNGQIGDQANNLASGSYDVTISDSDGCEFITGVNMQDPGLLSGLVWSDDNKNGFQDNDEGPLEFVNLTLNGIDEEGNQILKSFSTGDDGEYKFDGLPNGEYRIVFDVPENYRISPMLSGNDTTIDSDIDEDGITPTMTITNGVAINNISAGFYPCGIISDFVWMDSNRNGLFDNNENGLENIKVQLIEPGVDITFGTADDVIRAETYTLSNGSYSFNCITLGRFMLKFTDEKIDNGDFIWTIKNDNTSLTSNSNVNNDGTSDPFNLTRENLVSLSFGAGMYELCYGFANGGEINGEQTLCVGSAISSIEHASAPENEFNLNVEYQWIYSTYSTVFNTGSWIEIPDANAINYTPSDLTETTHFIRLVKTEGCDSYLTPSNVVTVTVEYPGPNCAMDTDQISLELFPNPTIEKMIVNFASPLNADAQMKIYDVNGHLVEGIELQEGMKFIEVNMNVYTAGMYIFKVQYKNADVFTTVKAFKE